MKSILAFTLGLSLLPSLASAGDPAELVRLYEEEILAHDLYVALGKVHSDVMPLRNIPHSEKSHRQAMAGVLKSEGIALPKPENNRRFVSEGLDETYKAWLAEGKKSAKAACRVGVRLEDHDIADLRKAQAAFPQHKEVLGQLEAASNNHLRAFHRNLTSRGGKYKPEALPAPELKAILNGTGGCGSGECGSGGEPGCGNPPNQAGRGRGNGWRGGR